MPRKKSTHTYHTFSIRLREDIWTTIREYAAQERRSTNAQIELILDQWVQRLHEPPMDQELPPPGTARRVVQAAQARRVHRRNAP